MRIIWFILPVAIFVAGCNDDDDVVFTKATVETKIVDELQQNNPSNEEQQEDDNTSEYTKVTIENAVEYFTNITDGEYFICLIGEFSQDVANQIGNLMREKPAMKIHLDLSQTTGLERFEGSYWNDSKYGFQNCDGLISIIMPKTLKRIEDWAFKQCRRLKTITLNEGLEYIGEYAFGVTEIGYQSSLEKVNIPSTVTAIGAGAFYDNNISGHSIEFSIAAPVDWYYTENKTYWEFRDDGTALDKLTSEILNDGGLWVSTEDGKRTLRQAYFYKR